MPPATTKEATMRKLTLFAAGLLLLAGLAPAFAQETRSFTDDTGRVVDIPVAPLRIVSLQDLAITVPLLELGVTPVGSHGRTTAEGVPFIRASPTIPAAWSIFPSRLCASSRCRTWPSPCRCSNWA